MEEKNNSYCEKCSNLFFYDGYQCKIPDCDVDFNITNCAYYEDREGRFWFNEDEPF